MVVVSDLPTRDGRWQVDLSGRPVAPAIIWTGDAYETAYVPLSEDALARLLAYVNVPEGRWSQ